MQICLFQYGDIDECVPDEMESDTPDLDSPPHASDINQGEPYDVCQSIEGVLTEDKPKEDINILITICRLLKQVSQVSSSATLKEIMTLTAVTTYVQLFQRRKSSAGGRLNKPVQWASLTAAHRMGKQPAFSHKIRETMCYISQFQRLPESHQSKKGGQKVFFIMRPLLLA